MKMNRYELVLLSSILLLLLCFYAHTKIGTILQNQIDSCRMWVPNDPTIWANCVDHAQNSYNFQYWSTMVLGVLSVIGIMFSLKMLNTKRP